MTEKIIVGLTGNIATGKSTIMGMAKEEGATTIDADKIVHEVYRDNESLKTQIGETFGPSVLHSDGHIHRTALGAIVFNDADAMKKLEAIVHPIVRAETANRIANAPSKIVFVEAIKLLDGPLAETAHQIWVTTCSEQKQIVRLMVYRGMSEEDARQRVSAQAPQADKIAKADVVILTNNRLSDTRDQFETAWDNLVKSIEPST